MIFQMNFHGVLPQGMELSQQAVKTQDMRVKMLNAKLILN